VSSSRRATLRRRPFCAEVSRESGEPLAATASRVDRWILVEYRGVWAYDALEASGLSREVKAHLQERAQALAASKVLFIRRTERRRDRALVVFWGASAESGSWLRRDEVEAYDELLGLGFEKNGEPVEHPLLLVCTHGKHDRCCARYGRPLYEALAEAAEEGWVWQCSHVGGDRFAGNLVILPEGLYFGRVGHEEAWTVLDEHLAGRIHMPVYRGRSCYSFPLQAAERAVRELTGARGLDAVRVSSTEPIRLEADGRVYEVEVVRESGELTYLTCASETLRHPRRYAAEILP
jgi:hypothetical protein